MIRMEQQTHEFPYRMLLKIHIHFCVTLLFHVRLQAVLELELLESFGPKQNSSTCGAWGRDTRAPYGWLGGCMFLGTKFRYRGNQVYVSRRPVCSSPRSRRITALGGLSILHAKWETHSSYAHRATRTAKKKKFKIHHIHNPTLYTEFPVSVCLSANWKTLVQLPHKKLFISHYSENSERYRRIFLHYRTSSQILFLFQRMKFSFTIPHEGMACQDGESNGQCWFSIYQVAKLFLYQ